MAEYIEREALLELYVDGKYGTADYHVPVPVIIQNIKDIPAADVVPVRHGRWTLLVSLNGDEHDKWKCSECGHYTRNGADRNFCPNCGAAMKDGDA